MEEVFKEVPGFEGKYEVSNLGRVKSINYRLTGRSQLLKFGTDGEYDTIVLFWNGKRTKKKVHRLVAETFIPNPNNYPQVNHKDENKHNNSVDNLEWCSGEYNSNYGNRNKNISKNSRWHKIY